MVMYRRARAASGTFFFTVTLADRGSDALTCHIEALREAFRLTRQHRPFTIDAIVVLPEHLHTIWTLPANDADYATRWQLIKTGFTRKLSAAGIRLPRHPNGEPALWQRRYWEHLIRDGADYERHMDYLHFNPVKHGHVLRVADWPHSSFHRYVRRGDLPLDWAGVATTGEQNFGEPR